ncbi:hypothetical protein LOTGIDRAFT_232224 [Lottia gigantea]|uniref:Transcription termination factor 2 n=1 Tax=Lottia gigantea TaxID=225164 RepID=V4AK84_LOTGI|nr:hypothetical protein LOTGIDRAFT_232224 [Lottia gigantea]ESO95145.1 hypothetical protein LOTGIDRAFT_232224 [Lottia gigantea]
MFAHMLKKNASLQNLQTLKQEFVLSIPRKWCIYKPYIRILMGRVVTIDVKIRLPVITIDVMISTIDLKSRLTVITIDVMIVTIDVKIRLPVITIDVMSRLIVYIIYYSYYYRCKDYYYRCKGKVNEEGSKSNWCGYYTPSSDTSASPFAQFSLPQSYQNKTSKYSSSQNGTSASNNHTSESDKLIAKMSETGSHSSIHNKENVLSTEKRTESKPVSQAPKLTVESSFGDLARKAPKQTTDTNKATLSSSPMAYRSKVKDLTAEVIEVVSSDDEDDENLDAARRQRQELNIQLEKQKNVVRSVKMSCLPDKGKKLMEDIEKLQKSIAKLDLYIQTTDQKLGHNTAKPGNTQRVYRVEQSGKPPLYQTITKPILPSPTETKPVMLASKPGSNQTILVTQPPPPGSNHTILLSKPEQLPPHILAQMYAANPQAMTLYGGRMTAARLREVTTVTKEALEKLHKQLESCPASTDELEDPKGLKVNLMTHQRQALAWLCWREGQNPAGGILADDMGLGKTLTSISLILKQRERRETGSKEEQSTWLNRDKQLEKLGKSVVKSNATLIVCPASLVHQWHKEIERRCQGGLLKVLLYHGANRERNILKLADNDIVLTTYNIISIEVGIMKGESAENAMKDDEEEEVKEEDGSTAKKQPNILRIAWERVILDEAHNIKNYKSKTSMSICKLRAGFRWALTGTPIQNDLLDMYSLLRFLRCTPFDEYKVWKRNVDNSKGTTRLNTIIRTLLLRRTKQQTNKDGQPLVPLPSKTVETYTVELTSYERAIYDKFFATTKSTVQNFVKRHEEKEAGTWNSSSKSTLTEEFQEKLKLNDSKGSTSGGVGLSSQSDGKTNASQLLVLILRLRQCCCHFSLMKQQLEDESLDLEGIEEKDNIELTLEEQMQGLLLESDNSTSDSKTDSTVPTTTDKPDLKLMFQPSHFSSKLKAVVEKIKSIRRESKKGQPLKSVIVSQWTKMLDVIGYHLQTMGISFSVIQGNIAAKKRTELVEDFNTNPSGAEVMLVSLRAGGVGLNLIGGNHLFIVDIHWNPALEQQACDRIFRVGQTRDVFIHKYVCKDTIEEKIVDLQKTKTQLAENVLTGSGAATQKLSLNDLRMMFGV